MFRRLTLASTCALTLALLIALPVAAGGWASVSLRQGTPTEDGGSTVGVTLLQHGVTPVDWGQVGIVAVNVGTGERLSFTGTPRLSDGQWTTWIELPAGSWNLAVTHQDLEVGTAEGLNLTIGEPSTAASVGSGAVLSLSPALALVLATVVLVTVVAAGGYLLLHRRVARTEPAHGGLVKG